MRLLLAFSALLLLSCITQDITYETNERFDVRYGEKMVFKITQSWYRDGHLINKRETELTATVEEIECGDGSYSFTLRSVENPANTGTTLYLNTEDGLYYIESEGTAPPVICGSTIEVLPSNDYAKILAYPLEIGKVWQLSEDFPSYAKVVNQELVSTEAGNFNAWKIYFYWETPEDTLQTIWITGSLLVKKSYTVYDFWTGERIEVTWELTGYDGGEWSCY